MDDLVLKKKLNLCKTRAYDKLFQNTRIVFKPSEIQVFADGASNEHEVESTDGESEKARAAWSFVVLDGEDMTGFDFGLGSTKEMYHVTPVSKFLNDWEGAKKNVGELIGVGRALKAIRDNIFTRVHANFEVMGNVTINTSSQFIMDVLGEGQETSVCPNLLETVKAQIKELKDKYLSSVSVNFIPKSEKNGWCQLVQMMAEDCCACPCPKCSVQHSYFIDYQNYLGKNT